MARYIDLDDKKFPKRYDDLGDFARGWNACLGTIYKLQTADVAPKSEVDELIYKLECLLCHATGGKLSKHTYDLRTMETVVTDYIQESYDEGYKDGGTDVAREIFAEIEKVIGDKYESYVLDNNDLDSIEQDAIINFSDELSDSFEEIKKKYTEEKE